jgi:hypothetical protein
MILMQEDNMRNKIKMFIALALLILAGCQSAVDNANKNTAPGTKTVTPDPNLLVGEWIRTDGGYRLKIFSATADGKLDAGYFNPSPIHVGQAGWQAKDNHIILTVVLQDINYPGSTYTLQFFPKEDRLVGNYYQAVEKANYGVEFLRQQ